MRDDGRGGVDVGVGSGLVGLADRIEALGGRLTVSSPAEVGTTVQAAIPLTVADRATAPDETAESRSRSSVRMGRPPCSPS